MWNWKRVVTVIAFVAGGIVTIALGQPAAGVALIAGGVGLATGIATPPASGSNGKGK